MKRILLFAAMLIAALSLNAQVIYSDNFDSIPVGNFVASSINGWTTWSNLPGSAEDGKISNVQANSGSNSVMVSKDNDLVLTLGDSTSGKYQISLKIFIPTDSNGYFNLLHKFAGGSSEWSNELLFDVINGKMHLFVGGNDTAQANFTFNVWHTITYIIDMDWDFIQVQLDGSEVFSWDYSLDGSGNSGLIQIGGMDFYGYDINSDGKTKLYVDDIVFEKIINTSLKNIADNQSVKLFPSPAENTINLQTTKMMKSVKICDLSGSVVKEISVDAYNLQSDITELASGIYFAQINFGNSIAIRKFVKK